MDTVNLIIDGQPVRAPVGMTILEAARSIDIYIPTLCHHPDLPPAEGSEAARVIFQGERELENARPYEPGQGCGLCLVQIEGSDELVGSCTTEVREGMVVATSNDRIKKKRRQKLLPIMTRHRHACLTCAQQEGCPRSQCSLNVPENERCCPQFGHCELQNLVNYVGLPDATPKWVPTDLTVIKDHPLFVRDYTLCIGCTRCVRACRDLRGIEAIGFVYDENGQVQVGTLAETLAASGCKFCTACVAVCPTGALVDKALESAAREEDLVPCRAACPAHIDVSGYLRMIAQGKADEANAIIREKVPFPGVLGRVCIHPCEQVCRRGDVNAPVAICALKRYAADGEKGLWKNDGKVASDTGKKVAVVGAGPAGLTAAFYLRKQGHAVTIFESGSQAGGMLRYGIPEFRLPRTVLDNEIRNILELGIDFRPNQALGKDISLDHMKNEGFDAVFLGIGAQQSRRIALDGCNTPDVLWGVEFLRRVAEGHKVELKERVVVIGGGNVALDAARTALRCGATDVKMACLECLDEMPAGAEEIAGAKAEGIQILPSVGPDKINSEDGKVAGLDLVACTGVFDDQGNFCPYFEDSKTTVAADQVILAIGQASETAFCKDFCFLDDQQSLPVARGLITINKETQQTDMQGVFAGGDAANGPATVIEAIAAGRRAAVSIDQYLGGDGKLEVGIRNDLNSEFGSRKSERKEKDENAEGGSGEVEVGNSECGNGYRGKRESGFAELKRIAVPSLPVSERNGGFAEVELCYSEEQALAETHRCLQCDLEICLAKSNRSG